MVSRLGRLLLLGFVLGLPAYAAEPTETGAEAKGEKPAAAAKFPPELLQVEAALAQRTLFLSNTPELPEHRDGVSAVAFSSDGRLVATASNDMVVKICNAKSGELVREIKVGEPDRFGSRLAIAFAPNQPTLAVGTSKDIKLYDLETGEVKKALTEGADELLQFTLAGDRLVSHSSSKFSVWSFPAGELERQFAFEGFLCDSFALTPDGELLACEGPKNSVDLYEVATGKLAHRFEGSQAGTVDTVAINAEGTLLAAGDSEERLVIYDLKAKKECFRAEDQDTSAMAFHPYGLLAVGFYGISLNVLGEKGLSRVGGCGVRGVTAVGQIAFSPDGSQMVATDQSHQHRGDLFSLEWSFEEETLGSEELRFNTIAASPDGRWLAWTTGRALILYSLADRKQLAKVELEPDLISKTSLTFTPDATRLIYWKSNSYQALLQIYSVPDLKSNPTWSKEFGDFGAVLTPDGKEVAILGENNNLLWNIAAGRARSWNKEGSEDEPTEIKGEQGRFGGGQAPCLITAKDHELFVYDWPAGKLQKSWHVGAKIANFAVSPDGTLAATFGNHDKRVAIWKMATGERAAELKIDAERVAAAQFSPDGKWLLTASADSNIKVNNRIKVWSTETWQLRASLVGHNDSTNVIAWAPGKSVFYTTGMDNSSNRYCIKRWDLDKVLARIQPPPPPKESPEPPPKGALAWLELSGSSNEPAGFIDGGRAVFYFDEDDHVRVFDLYKQAERWSVEVGDANWVEFSPDGRWFATTYGDDLEALQNENAKPGTVKIWDATTQVVVQTLTLKTSCPERVSFSPNGKVLAVASGDVGFDREGEISIWTVETGQRRGEIPVRPDRYTHIQFSPDAAFLAFGGFDDHVTVWDTKTNKERYKLKLDSRMSDLRFSADSKYLALCYGDHDHGRLHLLEAATGQPHPAFENFNEEAAAVAFSPRGDLLIAACSNDRNERGYRIWSLPDGKELRRLLPDSPRWGWGWIGVSPDGSFLAANVFGNINVWGIADLMDLEFQRSVAKLAERKVRVHYEGDRLMIEFGYGEASDLALQDLPILSRPFELNLRNSNGVTDAGMEHLARQKQLAGLHLAGCNNITPAGLDRLKALPLRRLDITDTKLNVNDCLALLPQWPGLDELKLTVNSDDDPLDLAPLAKLPKLRVLEFARFSNPGESLAHLGKLANLEFLKFSFADFADDDLKPLAGLTKLRHLDLNYAENLSGAGLAHLASCKQLETLVLQSARKLNDEGVQSIRQFAKLRTLDLSGTEITANGLAAVAGLKELEVLNLPEQLTDAGLAHLAELTRLRALDLSRREQITDQGLLYLAKLTSLEQLDLSSSPKIAGAGLAAFAGAKKLTDLDLRSLTGISDEGLRGVAKLTQLRELRLPPQVTDAGAAHLASLVNLQKLTLDETKLTDAAIPHLAKLETLEDLSLVGVPITDAAIPHLAKLRNLSALDVEKSSITPQGVEKLKKSFPEGHFLFIIGP